MPVVERNPLPRVALETREALHDWLEANHTTHGGIWLVQWRPSTGRPAIAYDDIVEECLIFGWIDSTAQSFDDQRGGVRLTPASPQVGGPRSTRSAWRSPGTIAARRDRSRGSSQKRVVLLPR